MRIQEFIRTVSGEQYTLEKCIGRGGEAEIFTLQEDCNLLYKCYTSAMDASISRKLQELIHQRYYELPGVMAPRAIVQEGDACLGFVMSRYGGVKCYDMDRVFNSPEEFLKTFSTWSRRHGAE